MTTPAIDEHRGRIRALLGIRASGEAVQEISAEPAADEVGASGAVAYQWDAPPVRAHVYLFERAADAEAAEDHLHADLDHPSVTTASTLNGRLLLWAMALADDPEGVRLLNELRSRFAGRE